MTFFFPHALNLPRPTLAGGAIAAAALLTVSHPVRAETAGSAEVASAEVGSAEAAAGDSAPQGEVVITEKARSHFRAGVNFLQDPDGARYEDAYRQFKLAYAESPSWKILGNLGICAMNLEKDGEAIDAFQRYLSEGGDLIPEDERAQVQRDIETLSASVVTVNIQAPAGGKLVDRRTTNRGASVTNYYAVPESGALSVRLRPGIHNLTLRASGQDDLVWELDAQPGETYEHSFVATETPEQGTGEAYQATDDGNYRPVPTSVWIGAGVTGALALGGTITGILALGKKSEYDEANQNGSSTAEGLRSDVTTMNAVTDVMFAGAIVAGGVTAVLYFTRPTVSRTSAFRIDPLVTPELAALSVSGSF